MDHMPSIVIRNRLDISHGDCWTWTIRRIDSSKFETSFDGTTYTYPITEIFRVVELIAVDHIKRHRERELFLIESNLGFSPYECSGKDLHRHVIHTLELFTTVIKIDHPPKLQIHYALQTSCK